MSGVKPRSYGGETASEREARRSGLLLETAFELVADGGWRALSIDAVCRRARLNKRYFYASFAGVDALVAELIDRLASDAIEISLAGLRPEMRPAEATRCAITAFVAHLTDDPRRARVLFGAVPAADEAAGHRAAAVRRIIAATGAQGRSMYALGDDPAVEVTAAMLVGGTSQALLDWLDGRVACSRAQLIDYLVALWCAVGDETAAIAGSA